MSPIFRYGCAVAALWAMLLASQGMSAGELKIGDRAPNLIGTNALDGSRFHLYRIMTEMGFKRDIRGRLLLENGKYVQEFRKYVVVINFFAKTCIPCLRKIPSFNEVAEEYGERPVKFLYVNVDPNLTPEQIRKLADDYRIKIPIAMVNQKEVFRKYDAEILPRLVIVDRTRRINAIFTGFDRNFKKKLTAALDEVLDN